MALWAIFGPLGAGPAGSGRWARACLEAGLTAAGLMVFSGGLSLLRDAGVDALAEGLMNGSVEAWRAWVCFFLLCSGIGLWVGDLWRMRVWHGRDKNPLLGDTTESF